MSKTTPTNILPTTPSSLSTHTDSVGMKKKRGVKRGTKMELVALRSGGHGKRYKCDSDDWSLKYSKSRDNVFVCGESDSDLSDSSYTYTDESDDDDVLKFDEMESECVRHMKENRILEVDKI